MKIFDADVQVVDGELVVTGSEMVQQAAERWLSVYSDTEAGDPVQKTIAALQKEFPYESPSETRQTPEAR